MSDTYVIFDYFKEAFHINRDNKVLYKPQIILILLRSLAILLTGGYIYNWVSKPGNLEAVNAGEYSALFSGLGIFMGLIVLSVFVLGILSLIVEAGLLNMYKASVLEQSVTMHTFGEGVSKYFFKLFGGYLLIMFGTIALILAFIFISIVTLGIGFLFIMMFSTVIALFIRLFLSFWKVSIVMDDKEIIDAFKYSFSFVKDNLIPIFILQIIHWSFSGSAKGSGSNFNSSNFGGKGNVNSGIVPPEAHKYIPDQEKISKFLQIGVGVAVPTITVMTAVASLIDMIFEVFFNLSLFIAYKYQFKQATKQEEVSF